MKNIDNVFNITKKDIIEVRKSRSKEHNLKENFPILYKLKSYFAKEKINYILLTKEEINDSYKKVVDNYSKRRSQ